MSKTWLSETRYSENLLPQAWPKVFRDNKFLDTKSRGGGACIAVCDEMSGVKHRSDLEFFGRICVYRNL
jgi:hypothetical protein